MSGVSRSTSGSSSTASIDPSVERVRYGVVRQRPATTVSGRNRRRSPSLRSPWTVSDIERSRISTPDSTSAGPRLGVEQHSHRIRAILGVSAALPCRLSPPASLSPAPLCPPFVVIIPLPSSLVYHLPDPGLRNYSDSLYGRNVAPRQKDSNGADDDPWAPPFLTRGAPRRQSLFGSRTKVEQASSRRTERRVGRGTPSTVSVLMFSTSSMGRIAIVSILFLGSSACDRDLDLLEPADFPSEPVVFEEFLTSSISFQAFARSKLYAF